MIALGKSAKSTQVPATTPEQETQQLIALATNLARKQLIDGTAPATVVTHFLKLGTEREALEREKIRRENLVLEAKAAALESNAHIEDLFNEAIQAFRGYSGEDDIDD